MELTRRQESVFRTLLDLYLESHRPLHYSELAERLGVSRFTAYDMLRLLEEKGLVRSEYQLAADKSGPGRSEIVFMPTESARHLLAQVGGQVEAHDWEGWRDRLLSYLVRDDVPEADLTQELFARIPSEEAEPLRYCVEVITIIFLRAKRGAGRRLIREFMPILIPTVETTDLQGLALFGGFALGVLVQENAEDYEWCKELLEHVQRCGILIADMPPAMYQRLVRVVQGLYKAFQSQEEV